MDEKEEEKEDQVKNMEMNDLGKYKMAHGAPDGPSRIWAGDLITQGESYTPLANPETIPLILFHLKNRNFSVGWV